MLRFVLLCSLIISSQTLKAQEVLFNFQEDDFVKVQLIKGSEFYGKVISMDETSIKIESNTVGTITLNKSDIESIALTEPQHILPSEPEDTFDNPNAIRHFLTETAFTVGEGTIQYHNIMLGGHIFTYGLSDDLSVSGAFELFSVFASDTPVLALSLKYTFDSDDDDIHFALGGNLLTVSDGGSSVFSGSVFGLTTFGNKNNNLTIGLGYAFYDGETTETPAVQIGGMTRLTENLMFVADQMLVSDNSDSILVGTLALRMMWENFSLDVGVGTDYNSGAIPIISGSYVF